MATDIKKWIVTVCHHRKRDGASFGESVERRAMCHSDQVAMSNKLREDFTSVGAEAIDIIALCTQQPKPNLTRFEKEEEEYAQTSRTVAKQPSPDSEREDDQQEGARGLTQSEKGAIKEVFREEVVNDVKAQLQEVRAKMRVARFCGN